MRRDYVTSMTGGTTHADFHPHLQGQIVNIEKELEMLEAGSMGSD